MANTQHAQIAIFKFTIYLEKPETQLFYYAIKTWPTVLSLLIVPRNMIQLQSAGLYAHEGLRYEYRCEIVRPLTVSHPVRIIGSARLLGLFASLKRLLISIIIAMAAKVGDRREESEEERFTFFLSADSPFSQWHPSEFTVDGVTYDGAEQFMMHQKAGKSTTDGLSLRVARIFIVVSQCILAFLESEPLVAVYTYTH